MNKIILSFITIISIVNASNSEFFKYYTDIETTAKSTMTNGKTLNSIVFSNPANILNITEKDGFVVNILNTSIGGSSNFSITM